MTEDKLLHLVDAFLNRVHGVSYSFSDSSIGELRLKQKREQEWCNRAGVYYFSQNGVIKYVGRATPSSGLGERVYNQINAYGGKNNWDSVITDGEVKCGLVIFTNNDDWHWLAALEVLLIDNLRPQYNYRT
ncbi:hypothetical protein NV379_02155 [Paenibacillus sp. N1-5-1-14]|uniref:hypothetical protein n=1 Tax=Paenibacillus radicibacter TaxID=2972488 RepID=UPI0021592AEF|nr:hypothetical protein [Paenibacillus radicibacter]MCR8641449.1 hypothetical protein [Paenibacillus radicibacter]